MARRHSERGPEDPLIVALEPLIPQNPDEESSSDDP